MTIYVKQRKTHDKAVRQRGVFEKVPGSGVWWIRYFDADGNKHREKVGTKGNAIKLYLVRKAEILNGAKLPQNLRGNGETVADVIGRGLDWYKEHRPKSVRSATCHLEYWKRVIGKKAALDLSPDDVDRFLIGRTELSPATKNRYKCTLSRVLQLEVIAGRLHRNAARLVQARKENNWRYRWLHDDEEARVVKAILQNCPAQLPAFIIALHTGMRAGEQFNLEWPNVDMERRKLFLEKTKNVKGNSKPREIPLNKTAYAMFEQLWNEREKLKPEERNHYVFQATRYKQPLKCPRQWFETVLRDAQVSNFRWHDLRHTFCSRLVMKRVDLRTVMELAGHRSIQVTARYAHLAPEHNTAAIEKLDE